MQTTMFRYLGFAAVRKFYQFHDCSHEYSHDFGVENYVKYYLSKGERSLCAKFRSGILPLNTKTGRWVSTSEEDGTCYLCDLNDIGNLFIFLLCTVHIIMI